MEKHSLRRSLKCILLSERSQSEKVTHCMIPTIKHSGKGKTIKTVKGLVAVKSWGLGLGRRGE